MKKLILGTAVVVAALGAGGVAYAAGDDPAPEQGYVTVENDATTPAPQQNGHDCPEKNGQGQGGNQGQGEQPSQPQQNQPSQPEQNPAGNA